MRAKYSPLIRLSVFRKISRSSLAPTGLYFELNLSNRWKVCLPCKMYKLQDTTVSHEKGLILVFTCTGFQMKWYKLEAVRVAERFLTWSSYPFLHSQEHNKLYIATLSQMWKHNAKTWLHFLLFLQHEHPESPQLGHRGPYWCCGKPAGESTFVQPFPTQHGRHQSYMFSGWRSAGVSETCRQPHEYVCPPEGKKQKQIIVLRCFQRGNPWDMIFDYTVFTTPVDKNLTFLTL